jgi:hypothetical protein
MLPDTGIDDVKKQRNAEYAKHINDPVLSSLKMEGIRLLFWNKIYYFHNVFSRNCKITAHRITKLPACIISFISVTTNCLWKRIFSVL